jgi:hypothetical protein
MSDLFTNLVGRVQGAGAQIRPLHPLYRGEGIAAPDAAPELVEERVTDPRPVTPTGPPPAPEPWSPRPEWIAPPAPVGDPEASEPVVVQPLPATARTGPPHPPPGPVPPPALDVTVVLDRTTRYVPVPVETTIERFVPLVNQATSPPPRSRNPGRHRPPVPGRPRRAQRARPPPRPPWRLRRRSARPLKRPP